MKIVIQRVSESSVTIDGKIHSSITEGMMILVGFQEEDNSEDIDWIIHKVLNLRIFDDENGIMNKSIVDIDGEIMIISQFTLQASTKKGNRPSYINAAKPEVSIPLYNSFLEKIELSFGKKIKSGIFGQEMKVSLINNGPVTIVIDTKNKK